MFEILPETKESAIIELNKILPGHTLDELAEAFDACVDIVKKQFGM
jgi:chemotaxis protein CheY-P-specific phosphatase CheC